MPPTSRNLRLRAVSLVCALIGLAGLALLVTAFHSQPWLRRGLLVFVAWQSFWYAVRIVVMIGIWRREPRLSSGQKWWLAFTAPVLVLLGVWLGHGRLSAWIEVGDDADGRPGDEAGKAAGADSR